MMIYLLLGIIGIPVVYVILSYLTAREVIAEQHPEEEE